MGVGYDPLWSCFQSDLLRSVLCLDNDVYVYVTCCIFYTKLCIKY